MHAKPCTTNKMDVDLRKMIIKQNFCNIFNNNSMLSRVDASELLSY